MFQQFIYTYKEAVIALLFFYFIVTLVNIIYLIDENLSSNGKYSNTKFHWLDFLFCVFPLLNIVLLFTNIKYSIFKDKKKKINKTIKFLSGLIIILFITSCTKERIYNIEISSCYYQEVTNISYIYKGKKEAKFELQYNNIPDPSLLGITYQDTTKKLVEINTGDILSTNVCNFKIL